MQALIKVFHDTEITMRQSDDGRWGMTAEQIGSALGYQNPRNSVGKLIREHRDEICDFLGETELVSPGGRQIATIVFDQGILILAMLCRTERAKEFRRWVADILLELKTGEKQLIDTTALTSLLSELKERREADARPQAFDPRMLMAQSMADRIDRLSPTVQKAIAVAVLALPPEKQTVWTAKQIVAELREQGIDVSWQKLGRLAKVHNLQCSKEDGESELGFWSTTSVNGYSKLVDQYCYSKEGRDRLVAIVVKLHETGELSKPGKVVPLKGRGA